MDIEIEFGTRIQRQEFKHLRPALKGWGEAIKEYCASLSGDDQDAPYYYNERANISLLAAGAWKAGIALEEYPTSKKRKDDEVSRGSPRCDLFILAAKKYEFQIEAKQGWMPAHLKAEAHQRRVERLFTAACKAAAENTESRARVGCVFFTPWWRTESKYKKDPSTHIAHEIKRYLEHGTVDAWAWCFPTTTRGIRDRESKGDNRFYPGVIVGLKASERFKLKANGRSREQ
jgi:hypothetical protein